MHALSNNTSVQQAEGRELVYAFYGQTCLLACYYYHNLLPCEANVWTITSSIL